MADSFPGSVFRGFCVPGSLPDASFPGGILELSEMYGNIKVKIVQEKCNIMCSNVEMFSL